MAVDDGTTGTQQGAGATCSVAAPRRQKTTMETQSAQSGATTCYRPGTHTAGDLEVSTGAGLAGSTGLYSEPNLGPSALDEGRQKRTTRTADTSGAPGSDGTALPTN